MTAPPGADDDTRFRTLTEALPALVFVAGSDGNNVFARIIDMHGGSIEAHSDGLGHGSEFVVRLPIAEAADQRTATAASAPSKGRADPVGRNRTSGR